MPHVSVHPARSITRTVLALAVASFALPAVVYAQPANNRSTGVAVSSDARARAAAARARNSTSKVVPVARDSARAPGAASFAALAGAMRALPDNSARFLRLRALRPEQVLLVDVRNVFKYSDDQRQFETALAAHDRQIHGMRAALQGSMVLRDVLYDRGLVMSQVIAVDVTPDGRGVIYYRAE